MNEDLFRPPRTFAGLEQKHTSFTDSRVVIIPAPYDSTSEYKCGSREGPQAIIDASQYLELYDYELGTEISRVGIYTLPEVQPLTSSPESMLERISAITSDLLKQNKLPVLLGGEHSLTIGAVKAFKNRYPDLSVLQLDAHADLRNEYMGTPYSHACVMRRVWETCPIVQAGIRSLSTDEYEFIKEHRLNVFFIETTMKGSSLDRIIAALTQHVYITIDLDVLDPSVMSAVGTPEPGGLTWEDILELLRTIAAKKHIVGFDIVELCPNQGPTACSFLAAKLAYKLIGLSTQAKDK